MNDPARPIEPARTPPDAPAEAVAPPGIRWIHCDLCGFRMLELHCKIRCLQCGMIRDCSDP